MSGTDNVTLIRPLASHPTVSLTEICEIVIRAKQIDCAVRVAHEQEGAGSYSYALEQAEDMLEEAQGQLSILEDAESREKRKESDS